MEHLVRLFVFTQWLVVYVTEFSQVTLRLVESVFKKGMTENVNNFQ